MKRSTGFLAGLALVATLFVAPSPAQAGLPQEKYATMNASGLGLLGWFWVDQIQGIIGCAKCVWMIDLGKSAQLTPDNEKLFQSALATGLSKLSDARVADPRTAEVLRRQATDSFQTAARALGTARARVGTVGHFNTETRVKTPSPQPWLAAADQDLVDGLTLLQAAAGEPVPVPWVTAAMAQFDEAFKEISTKQVIGS
ncbi:hypothetical protein [Catellatospora vulcania]|uniref:hypothetical protein n=1 Tax=Catellatospora vulcania TaxID=1460450 RepID=UPI0012D3FA91|nr:hypothetical protein [Catellatospora vulcania]